jgi:YndJ-like protein
LTASLAESMLRLVKRFTSDGATTAIVGGVAWAVIVAVSRLLVGRPSLIGSILAAGPLIVAPLALGLLHLRGARARSILRIASNLLLPAAVLAGVSLVVAHGAVAAGLATPWLLISLAIAAAGALSFFDHPSLSPRVVLPAAAAVFLGVGAGWLVVSSLGARPLGLAPVIVEMTALHFHFAGLGATIYADRLGALLSDASPRVRAAATASGFAVVVAPIVVATGFVFEPALGLAGAILYAAALPTMTILTWLALTHVAGRLPRLLLGIASTPLPFTIALGVAFAAGSALGSRAPSIDQMARYHGILNALAFIGCGLTGWTLVEPKEP